MIDINKYDFDIEDEAMEKFEWIIETLPDPWKTEFLEEVLVGHPYDFKTLNKVFMYYIDDCYSELPQKTQDEIDSEYIMIEL